MIKIIERTTNNTLTVVAEEHPKEIEYSGHDWVFGCEMENKREAIYFRKDWMFSC